MNRIAEVIVHAPKFGTRPNPATISTHRAGDLARALELIPRASSTDLNSVFISSGPDIFFKSKPIYCPHRADL